MQSDKKGAQTDPWKDILAALNPAIVQQAVKTYKEEIKNARKEAKKLAAEVLQRKKELGMLEPEFIENEKKSYDERCKLEVKESRSKELNAWLAKGSRQVRELGEMTRKESLRLAQRLYAHGAVKVWASGIERDEDGAEYSRRLIVSLPDSSIQQGKIFAACAGPARPNFDGSVPAARIGKRYMSVSLM